MSLCADSESEGFDVNGIPPLRRGCSETALYTSICCPHACMLTAAMMQVPHMYCTVHTCCNDGNYCTFIRALSLCMAHAQMPIACRIQLLSIPLDTPALSQSRGSVQWLPMSMLSGDVSHTCLSCRI